MDEMTGAGRIEQKLDALSTRVDERFEQVDRRFEQVDRRFAQVDRRLDAMTARMDERFREVSEHFVEQRQYTEFAFDTLRREMHEGFAAILRRLDGFIETQGGINRNHHERLVALERPRRRKA